MGLGIFQISSAIVQADRDKTVAKHFTILYNDYLLINDDAQSDIAKINQYLFNNNQRKFEFSGMFRINLNIHLKYSEKNYFELSIII